ncbi:cytochrome P450 71B10-like protein [Corchorus olitorius]|uniref:Cytochrome P450 71B10-like protein n=1 Tax=Corchorus olitorius TaxID=93759 RepID=A0A1R3JI96_9ROSI|nr:cytochrome P450 71B10-like protein [Corchorus olitorius]
MAEKPGLYAARAIHLYAMPTYHLHIYDQIQVMELVLDSSSD